ncbi:hypothetical protein [Dictyobacter aurantiacus]|uniref:hypothetical protein n=1 Tax=Dictyobacter aurantiacus TaxID=1936993 RepID=UPI001357AD42|nr:hypothetical protein [Dictyobacter aurantiacus]
MMSSYIVLWTAFYVDSTRRISLPNHLPPLTLWVPSCQIDFPFLVLSLPRFARAWVAPSTRSSMERRKYYE